MHKAIRALLVIAGIGLSGCGGGGGDSFRSGPESGDKQTLSAYLEVVPRRWEEAAKSVEAWTTEAGGRLLRREKDTDRSVSYSLRIPTPKAEDFFQKVRQLGEVLNERTSLTDISRQYVDIESRLKAKEEAVERLKGLFRAARTPSEILEVEKALQQALTERDELRSQYENARLLSESVQVDLTLRNRQYVEYSEGGSYWEQLFRSMREGWKGFVYFTFFVAYLWWLWLLIALGIVLLVRLGRRQKGAYPPQPPKESV